MSLRLWYYWSQWDSERLQAKFWISWSGVLTGYDTQGSFLLKPKITCTCVTLQHWSTSTLVVCPVLVVMETWGMFASRHAITGWRDVEMDERLLLFTRTLYVIDGRWSLSLCCAIELLSIVVTRMEPHCYQWLLNSTWWHVNMVCDVSQVTPVFIYNTNNFRQLSKTDMVCDVRGYSLRLTCHGGQAKPTL